MDELKLIFIGLRRDLATKEPGAVDTAIDRAELLTQALLLRLCAGGQHGSDIVKVKRGMN